MHTHSHVHTLVHTHKLTAHTQCTLSPRTHTQTHTHTCTQPHKPHTMYRHAAHEHIQAHAHSSVHTYSHAHILRTLTLTQLTQHLCRHVLTHMHTQTTHMHTHACPHTLTHPQHSNSTPLTRSPTCTEEVTKCQATDNLGSDLPLRTLLKARSRTTVMPWVFVLWTHYMPMDMSPHYPQVDSGGCIDIETRGLIFSVDFLWFES